MSQESDLFHKEEEPELTLANYIVQENPVLQTLVQVGSELHDWLQTLAPELLSRFEAWGLAIDYYDDDEEVAVSVLMDVDENRLDELNGEFMNFMRSWLSVHPMPTGINISAGISAERPM